MDRRVGRDHTRAINVEAERVRQSANLLLLLEQQLLRLARR